MILHIVPDDKFIDMAYDIFEEASPKNNRFIVVTNNKELKFVKTKNVIKKSIMQLLSSEFSKSLKEYEFVVIHKLQNPTKKLILNADKSVKFVWLGWGFDYYCYIKKPFLLNKTKILDNTSNSLIKKIIDFIKFKTVLKGVLNTKEVFNKIDYFAPVLYEDYILVKKEFSFFSPKYIDWNYGTLEAMLGKVELELSGNNILLGNSASLENNHIEAIDKIVNLNLKEKQIITPLSYGLESYKNKIIEYGNLKIKDNFTTLVEFMSIDEYNKIISTCSIVVMNHLRQQAVGNIIVMLYFGAKVFLNKSNPVYTFFKDKNAYIYNMDELNDASIELKLSKTQIEVNRTILKEYWAKDIILNKTKKLIIEVNKNES